MGFFMSFIERISSYSMSYHAIKQTHFVSKKLKPALIEGRFNADKIGEVLATEECHFTIGIDEVGRGPLYGSVVVAGLILPSNWVKGLDVLCNDNLLKNKLADTPLANLTDSKKLSDKKRQALIHPIKNEALAYVLVDVPANVIDEINIFQATMLGMRLAGEHLMHVIQNEWQTQSLAKQISVKTSPKFTLAIDGNKLPRFDWAKMAELGILQNNIACEAWVKGDARHPAIAGASVLAKVARDNDLINDAKLHPEYGLDKHKGYPTKAHLQAIAEHGVLPKHRRSFKPVRDAIQGTIVSQ